MIPIANTGRSKRGRSVPVSYLYTTIVVLTLLVFFIGSSLWHTRSTFAESANEVIQLSRKLKTSERELKQHRTSVTNLEARVRQLEGSLADATRDLHVRDVGLKELEEQRERADVSRMEKEASLEAKLEFEKSVVKTLNATIAQMESAHTAREADWHELSARWMQFEKELTGDNERLLAELAKHKETQNVAAEGGFAQAHTMPNKEPLSRTETEFKPRTQLPKEDDYLARQRQLFHEQERLYMEQQALAREKEQAIRNIAGGVEGEESGRWGRRDSIGGMGRKGGMGDLGGHHMGENEGGRPGGEWERPEHETKQEQDARDGGNHGVDHHLAPDIGHFHHDDHYDSWVHDGAHAHWDDNYHPGDWDYEHYHGHDDRDHNWDRYDEDYGEHFDPLDQAWINDGASPDANNWPGSHPPQSHHGEPIHSPEDLPVDPHRSDRGGVQGRSGDIPVLGKEDPPVLGRDNPPVLGRGELPVLGKDPQKVGEEVPVLGRDPQKVGEEVPVLGRDPQRGEAEGESSGRLSRWQRIQDSAIPGRFRHGG